MSARGCASATHSSRRRSVPTAIYDYAVIRAVPRVEREEFVNVGVIVSCQSTGLLEAGIELDPARVRALDPHVDLAALRADRKSTRLNSSPSCAPRMPSSAWKKQNRKNQKA